MISGIAHAQKFEFDGFFGLMWKPLQITTAADLGRGSAEVTARFLTGEGRTYFIQAEACRERCAQLACDLEDVQRQLRKIAEKKEKRRLERLSRWAGPDMPMKEPGVPWTRFDLGCPPDPLRG